MAKAKKLKVLKAFRSLPKGGAAKVTKRGPKRYGASEAPQAANEEQDDEGIEEVDESDSNEDGEPSDEALSKEDGGLTTTGKDKESDDEPSSEELSAVEKEVEEESKKALPAAAKDVLSGYMEQLSHIPLFTPDLERRSAEKLVELEIGLWVKILQHPLAYDVLAEACLTMERDVQELIFELKKNIKRAASRTSDRKTKFDRDLEELAFKLRYVDNDKEVMEDVVARLRRSAWNKSKRDESKVGQRDMLSIERSRGEALRARNDFVRANLRLVVSVARSFHHVRLPLIDLIQEGNVGLMKAVHRYDHRRGFRFSTYAIWWIRQAIERAIINKGSAVRLPVHVIDSRRQVSRASNKLTQKLGRAPTTAELSKTLHMSQGKLNQILAGVHQDPVSLDDPISSDDPRNYLDMVRDENTPALDESLIRENTRNRIRELLTLLSPIEKDIIRRRFGMHDGQDQTLDEIGKHYNLSRERVRQIQTQGLMKMRRMCERRKIGTR